MSDRTYYFVVCRFPGCPGFGVRYLIKVANNEEARGVFLEQFKSKIGSEFNGEILFFEEVDCCVLFPAEVK